MAQTFLTTVTRSIRQKAGLTPLPNEDAILPIGSDLTSDLPLQMSLYFNVMYVPFWLATCIAILTAKYNHLDEYYKFVLIVIYIIMTVVETIRLYLGYSGNLQERVPELAGFWLVTTLLQLPLTCFLLFNEGALVMPMERAVHITLLSFIVFEIIQGYRVVKRMTDNQVTKFHMRQFDDMIEMEELGPSNINGVQHLKEE